ncbi:glycosyltransferase [Streptomyces sp. NPDC093085]|uniref:glycosyltransferase n=1 Tax=Streptomyces sp. NPDC093085 TaxID=3155068 RepID=UPI003438F935
MRILFSSTPAFGHLLPQLPLARAFRDRGDEVAVLTSASFGPLLAAEHLTLHAVGPEGPELLAEATRRSGASVAQDATPEVVAEYFAGARVDLTADAAIAAAREFRPDLIVAESMDYVAPMVAAALKVPYADLAFGLLLPGEFADAFDAAVESRHKERGLTVPPATWYLDPCPELLLGPGWEPPHGRLALRPEAHRGPGASGAAPAPAAPPADGARPRVLLSFGTHYAEPAVLRPVVDALAPTADLVVTLGLTATPADYGDGLAGRVEFAEFTPLAELLDGIDLVVTHGGSGTMLGTLSRGLPMVVVPQGADQFLNAGAVAGARAGVAVLPPAGPEAVAEAVTEVLGRAEYRENARRAAEQIAAMPAPSEVAERLAAELG